MIWVDASLAEHLPAPVFETLDALPNEVYREVESRSTRRVTLAGQALFVKLHRGIGWQELLLSLTSLRLPVLGAGNEVRALRRLQDHGIRCAAVRAWGQRGWNPARRRSFVLLEALDDFTSLEDVLAAGVNGAQRRRLAAAVGELTCRVHDAGVNHRDLYICHVLLRRGSQASLAVLDLHRAQVRSHVPRRWRIKDLASLLYSVRDVTLSRRDQLRFVIAYTRADPALRRDVGFWRAVRQRAARIAIRERRTGRRDTALEP